MKKTITLLSFFFSLNTNAQSLYFPPLIGNNWDTISPASLGWCQEKIDTLLNYLENKNTKAFILLKDGKIAIEKYYGTFTQDSLWYWASAGKTLTSFMVGIAQQENYLSINDITSKYLGQGWTNCTTAQEEKITIRHQLTMTSGLDDGGDPYCTLDTCLNYLADAGTRWAYHNAPYTLLDQVIENATGQTFNDYIAQKLKVPTGMTGLFVANGYNNVFISKPRSMARFGLLILNHGSWNGNQIMTDTSYFNQMVNTSQTLNPSYGYLWWLNGKSSFMLPGTQFVFPGPLNPDAPADMFAAMGKNGQFLNIVPSMNLVYVRMGNAPGIDEVPFTINDTIWRKLNKVFCGMVSIQGVKDNNQLLIYPNPVDQYFNIELPGYFFDVQLSDITGKEVYRTKNTKDKLKIDCADREKGIYILNLETGYETVTRKIIKL